KVKVHLALDLPESKAMDLQNVSDVRVLQPQATRRVYFLAINHRTRPALKNPEFRQALAHAIDRERILDLAFRGEMGHRVHKALDGPYPADSWACRTAPGPSETKSLDMYNSRLARSKMEAAKTKASLLDVQLSLKYPTGDPRVEQAMQYLAQ